MNFDKILLNPKTAERMMRELPEDKFRIMVYAAAELFRTVKKEAERRGIWDDIKTKKK